MKRRLALQGGGQILEARPQALGGGATEALPEEYIRQLGGGVNAASYVR